jgi:starch-binding outer membrane protein, SusD/RagB family
MRNPIIVFLLLLLQVFGSCKKFVQVPPPTNSIITPEVFADSASAMAGITGIYINMWNRGSATMGSGGVDLYAGCSSDEMSSTSTVTADQQINADNIMVTNSYVSTLWQTAYTYIYQANACIAGAAASATLSPTVQNRVIGQAKFVRAFMYFNLVNLFGAVPQVLTTNYNVTASEPRTSVDSVYGQILADLLAADSLLSPDPSPITYTRPNGYTASALLARVYLYRQQWADAETYATRAMGGSYTLLSNLDSVFLNGSKEAIWQTPAPAADYETVIGAYIVPYAPSGVLPQYIASPQVIAAFETGDKRAAHWMQSTVVGATTYYYPNKYKIKYDALTTPQEAYTPFRLAEQYLIRAEARAQQGNLSVAAADLNIIRARAGLAPTTASAEADLLTAIQHERQTELCFEGGHRWYDLKRTGTVNAVMAPVKPAWTPTAALYPIPYGQTQLNPFLTQNPGY